MRKKRKPNHGKRKQKKYRARKRIVELACHEAILNEKEEKGENKKVCF